jgi:acetoin utilization protein AcuB
MDLARLDHIPAITAVMTPFPYSVDVASPLSAARAMMREHEIRHLPVTEGGRLVGVLTERESALASRPEGARVGEARIQEAYTVELTEPLDRVLLRMARDHLGSALVVKRGKLVGIFTVTDACRLLGEVLQARFPEDDDAA